jgi:hypothetical protein
MNNGTFMWVLMVAVVGVAALLLWLRDRFRDLRHVPEAERKISEQKNAIGANAFVCFMCGALCLYRLKQEPVLIPGIYYAIGAALFASGSVIGFVRYRKLGVPRDSGRSN